MTSDKEPLYWKSNKNWWYIGEDNCYHLTDEAPDRAVKSFELWKSPKEAVTKVFVDLTD